MPAIDLIDCDMLSPQVQALIVSAPMPGLQAGPQCAKTKKSIVDLLSPEHLRGSLSEAALWLLAGELELSHKVSQSIESAEGSYWHGIMHRREGDFWNAKYWLRRVGKHPVRTQLAKHIEMHKLTFHESGLPLTELVDSQSVAEALVDLSERAVGGKASWSEPLQKICWWEWQLLFQLGL